jgi:hypothetical protein
MRAINPAQIQVSTKRGGYARRYENLNPPSSHPSGISASRIFVICACPFKGLPYDPEVVDAYLTIFEAKDIGFPERL